MGIFFNKENLKDFITEDNEATKFEPENFNELMEKIELLKELDENIGFYRELNIKKELLDKILKKIFEI